MIFLTNVQMKLGKLKNGLLKVRISSSSSFGYCDLIEIKTLRLTMCQKVAVFPPPIRKLMHQKKEIHSKLLEDGSNVLAVISPLDL